jgi:hypothetical protein
MSETLMCWPAPPQCWGNPVAEVADDYWLRWLSKTVAVRQVAFCV